jgi:hypothetical protein
MRKRFVVSEAERAKFWRKINKQNAEAVVEKEKPKPPWRSLFATALPEPISLVYWPRTAGTGSLGRPRWLAYGTWRNGPLLREGKALATSAWIRAQGGPADLRLSEIASGHYRSPDPWYQVSGQLLVRRLSPNNHKIDVAAQADLPQPDILSAMGRDLAAAHLSEPARRGAVSKDLATRKRRWFRDSVENAAEFVTREYAEWKKSAK